MQADVPAEPAPPSLADVPPPRVAPPDLGDERLTREPPCADESDTSVAAASDEGEPEEPPEPLTREQRNELMLRESCGECHAGDAADGGVRDIDDIDYLVAVGLVIPFASDRSRVVQSMLDGSVPPSGVQPRPSERDVAELIDYIDADNFWGGPLRRP